MIDKIREAVAEAVKDSAMAEQEMELREAQVAEIRELHVRQCVPVAQRWLEYNVPRIIYEETLGNHHGSFGALHALLFEDGQQVEMGIPEVPLESFVRAGENLSGIEILVAGGNSSSYTLEPSKTATSILDPSVVLGEYGDTARVYLLWGFDDPA